MRSVRLLAVLVTLLFLPLASRAQFPFHLAVQSGDGQNTCTFGRPVRSGNYVFALSQWYNSTATPSVTDGSNTYAIKANDSVLSPTDLSIGAAVATAGSSGNITVSFSVSGASFQTMSCWEFPPLFSLTLDGTPDVKRFTGSFSTISGNPVTTNFNNDVIMTYCGDDHNNSRIYPGTGYSFLGMVNGNDASGGMYKVAGLAGSETGSCGLAGTTSAPIILTMAFRPNSITIQSPSVMPDGALSNAYDYTLLATGGVGARTWSITSGSLQSGLSLNTSTGEITGTPTGSSTNNITFQVTDGTSTTTKAVTLKIGATLNTIGVLQVKNSGSNVDAGSITFTGGVTAGSVIGIAGGNNSVTGDGRVQSCIDTLGTVFYPVCRTLLSSPTALGDAQAEIFLGVATSSGSDSVTCTAIRGIVELSNAQFTGDNTSGTMNNSATPITNALATLVPGEAILSLATGFTNGTSLTVSSPFTGVNSAENSVLGYQIGTTVTSYTASYAMTGNTSGWWAIAAAGIRPTASAPLPSTASNHHSRVF